jgi:hypothetical protein
MKRSRTSGAPRRAPAPSAFELHGSATISPEAARVLERLGLALIALVALALLAMMLGPHRIGDHSPRATLRRLRRWRTSAAARPRRSVALRRDRRCTS